jgi:hypothetical protein
MVFGKKPMAFRWAGVFISRGCPNKLLQTRWLQTTEVYAVTVLETRSLTSRIQELASGYHLRVHIPSFVATLIQSLPPSSDCYLISLCIFYVSIDSSYEDTGYLEYRLHTNSVRPHLNLIISAKTLLLNKDIFSDWRWTLIRRDTT